MAIAGPAGSGKTYTALLIAKRLGERVACIDTERGSASKYAGDVAEFDTQELSVFAIKNYLSAIAEAASAGYDVLVIDSLTHAWAGKGGILEEADKRGGKFQAWKELTPMQQSLVDAILSYPGHVIATMRSKMAYEVSTSEGANGRKETKVEKLGLAPVQRDDLPYEFDVWVDMDVKHVGHVSKSRCSAIEGEFFVKPGEHFAALLKQWLTDGAAPAKPATRPGELDEYGLRVPMSQCPRFSANAKEHAGRLWTEHDVGWLVAKHLAEYGERMNATQREWAEYIVERRLRRKAAEEAAKEQEAAEKALAAAKEQEAAQ